MSYDDVSMFAIALEVPVEGVQTEMRFESFPEEGLVEGYTTKPYGEIDGYRQPAATRVTYKGGRWDVVTIEQNLRAGPHRATYSPGEYTAGSAALDAMLKEVEDKVNWYTALAFPQKRLDQDEYDLLVKQLRESRSNKNVSNYTTVLARVDPPKVLLIWGGWRTIRAYMKRIRIHWEGPWEPITGRPYGAKLTMEFQPIPKKQENFNTIAGRARPARRSLSPGGFRAATLNPGDTQRGNPVTGVTVLGDAEADARRRRNEAAARASLRGL